MRCLRNSLIGLSLCFGCAPGEVDEDWEGEVGGKADEINPNAGTAVLTISAPDGAPVHFLAQRLDEGGGVVELSTMAPVTLSPGRYCFWTTLPNFATKKDCSVDLVTGDNHYGFGAVQFVRSSSDLLYGVDLPREEHQRLPEAVYFLSHEEPVPHAVGAFEYAYRPEGRWTNSSWTMSVPVEIAADEATEIDLVDLEGRRAVRIHPASDAALPDAPLGQLALCQRGTSTPRNCGRFHNDAETPVLVFAPLPDVQAMELWYFGSAFDPLKIDAFDLPETPGVTDVFLERLDVHDVEIDLGGTVQTISGTVTIHLLERADGSHPVSPANVVASKMPTGTGIDVPPALYRVTTRFRHPADNAWTEHVEEVDLR